MSGIHFDDARPGLTIRHALARTVTQTDNVLFCAITHNPQLLLLDEGYAKQTQFGRRAPFETGATNPGASCKQ